MSTKLARARVRSGAAALLLPLLAVPGIASADRRYYGETYNAAVAPPGGLDVELWTTFHEAPPAGGTDFWRTQLELETGLLPRWDLALYNVFRSEGGEGTRYEALKVETRYGLADPGAWPVDVVLYLEVAKEFIEDRPWSLEGKVIVARDLGPVNLSLNLAAEQEWISGGSMETELGGAFGASLEVVPALRLGGEVFGGQTRVSEEGGVAWESKAWAGPALSAAALQGWLVLAVGFGLTEESDRVRARAILAWQF